MEFEPGEETAGLVIERVLGCGAYGTVYLARDKLIGRPVALKVVAAQPDTRHADQDRALREARAVGRLNSPNIVTLFRVDSDADDRGWLFQMEYVPGGSLGEWLEREPQLPPEQVDALARGILGALDASHEAGIVHGDVKPGNVLIGEGGMAKLADFGLARMVGDLALTASQSDGDPVGTPQYMAPEVVMGQAPEKAADLWSTGVVLYRALAGAMPFRGETFNEFFFAVMNAEPDPLGPEIPTGLRALVEALLAKRPDDRPESAQAAVALLDAPPAPTVEPAPAIAAPVLYGREAEEGRLDRLLRDTARGRGATVLLTGANGIGKSALVRALQPRAVDAGCRWVETSATPVEGVALSLVRAVNFRLQEAGVHEVDNLLASLPSAVSRDLLRNLLESRADLNLATHQQLTWALEELLVGLAADQPLALVLEDAHRLDPDDLALVRELARRLPEHPVFFLVTYGTRMADSSASEVTGYRDLVTLPGLQHVELGPLSREAIYRVLETRTDAVRLAPDVAQRIVELAEGNPLFAGEILKQLEEAGAVQLDGSLLRAGPTWQEVSLPARFHDLVTVRIGGLPEEQRAILDVAAVDGRAFDAEALAAVLERPALSVLRDLQRLYRDHALVEPDGESFRFTSTLVQEVIYEELAPALRRALHEQLARHLDVRADRPDPERVGLHWAHAGHLDRARPYLIEATRAAAVRQDYGRALRLARRVGLLPGQIDEETAYAEAATLLKLADVLYGRGAYAEMGELYDVLLAAARKHDDTELQDRCEVNRALAAFYTKGLAGVARERIERVTQTLPASRELGYAHYLLGLVVRAAGDVLDAAERFRRADEVFIGIGHHAGHSAALNELAGLARREGRYEEAEELFEESARISEAIGRLTNAAMSRVNRDFARFARAEFSGLEASVERSIRTLQLEGAGPQAAHAAVFLADLRFAQGDPVGASRATGVALELLHDQPYLPALATARLQEAQVAMVRGQLDSARRKLAAVREAVREAHHADVLLDTVLLEAHVAGCLGDEAGARTSAAEALALAEGTTDPTLRRIVVYGLAEATLLGLPPDALPEQSPSDDLPGVWAAARPGAFQQPLAEAAQALRESKDGLRHATHRIVAARLAIEAARRGGKEREAREAAEHARDAARAFGHVWHELGALRMLDSLAPAPKHRDRAEVLLRTIADDLASEDERTRVRSQWRWW